MKKMFSLFLALAVVLSVMAIPASATEIEPYVEIGLTCSACGGPSVHSRTSGTKTYDFYDFDCPFLDNLACFHTKYFTDDYFTCRNCGNEDYVRNYIREYCHASGGQLIF